MLIRMNTLKNSLTGHTAKCSTEQTDKPLCLVGVLYYFYMKKFSNINP